MRVVAAEARPRSVPERGRQNSPVSSGHFSSRAEDPSAPDGIDADGCWLSVAISEARNLLASDAATGTSDPVCFVAAISPTAAEDAVAGLGEVPVDGPSAGVAAGATGVAPRSCDPVWRREPPVVLQMPWVDSEEALRSTRLLIVLRDGGPPREGRGAACGNLGQTSVTLEELLLVDGRVSKRGDSVAGRPRWRELRKRQGMRRVEGSVRFSAALHLGRRVSALLFPPGANRSLGALVRTLASAAALRSSRRRFDAGGRGSRSVSPSDGSRCTSRSRSRSRAGDGRPRSPRASGGTVPPTTAAGEVADAAAEEEGTRPPGPAPAARGVAAAGGGEGVRPAKAEVSFVPPDAGAQEIKWREAPPASIAPRAPAPSAARPPQEPGTAHPGGGAGLLSTAPGVLQAPRASGALRRMSKQARQLLKGPPGGAKATAEWRARMLGALERLEGRETQREAFAELVCCIAADDFGASHAAALCGAICSSRTEAAGGHSSVAARVSSLRLLGVLCEQRGRLLAGGRSFDAMLLLLLRRLRDAEEAVRAAAAALASPLALHVCTCPSARAPSAALSQALRATTASAALRVLLEKLLALLRDQARGTRAAAAAAVRNALLPADPLARLTLSTGPSACRSAADAEKAALRAGGDRLAALLRPARAAPRLRPSGRSAQRLRSAPLAPRVAVADPAGRLLLLLSPLREAEALHAAIAACGAGLPRGWSLRALPAAELCALREDLARHRDALRLSAGQIVQAALRGMGGICGGGPGLFEAVGGLAASCRPPAAAGDAPIAEALAASAPAIAERCQRVLQPPQKLRGDQVPKPQDRLAAAACLAELLAFGPAAAEMADLLGPLRAVLSAAAADGAAAPREAARAALEALEAAAARPAREDEPPPPEPGARGKEGPGAGTGAGEGGGAARRGKAQQRAKRREKAAGPAGGAGLDTVRQLREVRQRTKALQRSIAELTAAQRDAHTGMSARMETLERTVRGGTALAAAQGGPLAAATAPMGAAAAPGGGLWRDVRWLLEAGQVEQCYDRVLRRGGARDLVRLLQRTGRRGGGGPPFHRRLSFGTCDRLFAAVSGLLQARRHADHLLPVVFDLVRAGDCHRLSKAVRGALARALYEVSAEPRDHGELASVLHSVVAAGGGGGERA